MKRTRIIITTITAITALLALTALTSIASAATETTKILPEPTGAAPITFSATSPAGKLETIAGHEVACKKDTGNGTFTSPNLGWGKTLFDECTSALSSTCTGVGDATGTIEAPGTIHYVLALEMITRTTSTLVAAFAFLVAQFHFTCTTSSGIELLVLTRGCVAGVASPTNILTKNIQISFKEFSKGENKILSILMENNFTAETKCLLEASISEEKTGEDFELAALIGEASLTGWTQSGSAITILLMN